jgi:hypothetical protein
MPIVRNMAMWPHTPTTIARQPTSTLLVAVGDE